MASAASMPFLLHTGVPGSRYEIQVASWCYGLAQQEVIKGLNPVLFSNQMHLLTNWASFIAADDDQC